MALVNTESIILEVAFPNWHAWISDAGHCWAAPRLPGSPFLTEDCGIWKYTCERPACKIRRKLNLC